MLVRLACVNLQTGSGLRTELGVGQHALYCKLHGLLGLGCHQGLVLNGLQTADVTGVVVIVLVLQLVAGKNCLVSVDDDDKLAAVNVGGELGAMLAAQNGSCLNGGLAKGLACRINDKPTTLDRFCLCHKSGHDDSSINNS